MNVIIYFQDEKLVQRIAYIRVHQISPRCFYCNAYANDHQPQQPGCLANNHPLSDRNTALFASSSYLFKLEYAQLISLRCVEVLADTLFIFRGFSWCLGFTAMTVVNRQFIFIPESRVQVHEQLLFIFHVTGTCFTIGVVRCINKDSVPYWSTGISYSSTFWKGFQKDESVSSMRTSDLVLPNEPENNCQAIKWRFIFRPEGNQRRASNITFLGSSDLLFDSIKRYWIKAEFYACSINRSILERTIVLNNSHLFSQDVTTLAVDCFINQADGEYTNFNTAGWIHWRNHLFVLLFQRLLDVNIKTYARLSDNWLRSSENELFFIVKVPGNWLVYSYV